MYVHPDVFARHAGADGDGLGGVHQQAHEDLVEFGGPAFDVGQLPVLPDHIGPVFHLAPHDAQGGFDAGMQVRQGPERGLISPCKFFEIAHDAANALDAIARLAEQGRGIFLDEIKLDLLFELFDLCIQGGAWIRGALPVIGLCELHQRVQVFLQGAQVGGHEADRVVDLMGQPRRQLPQRGQFVLLTGQVLRFHLAEHFIGPDFFFGQIEPDRHILAGLPGALVNQRHDGAVHPIQAPILGAIADHAAPGLACAQRLPKLPKKGRRLGARFEDSVVLADDLRRGVARNVAELLVHIGDVSVQIGLGKDGGCIDGRAIACCVHGWGVEWGDGGWMGLCWRIGVRSVDQADAGLATADTRWCPCQASLAV